MHVFKNVTVYWFLHNAFLPPFVRAGRWILTVLSAFGKGLDTGLQVTLQKELIHRSIFN